MEEPSPKATKQLDFMDRTERTKPLTTTWRASPSGVHSRSLATDCGACCCEADRLKTSVRGLKRSSFVLVVARRAGPNGGISSRRGPQSQCLPSTRVVMGPAVVEMACFRKKGRPSCSTDVAGGALSHANAHCAFDAKFLRGKIVDPSPSLQRPFP